MPAYSASLQGADTRAVVAGVIDVLQSKPAAPESLEWLNVCTQSGRCSAACPEGINAMKMVRVGRIAALGALGGPVQIQARDDPVFFRRIGAFSQLQLTAEEIEQWQR